VNMATVVSINISEKKGTVKSPVPEAMVMAHGVAGDAHAGPWHRQISILSREIVEAFGRDAGRVFSWGAFGENLTTEGLDLTSVSLLDRLRIGEVELEITQIGKKCHGGGCAIFHQVGQCVMPKEGIFARVIRGGTIRSGGTLVHVPRHLRIRILTLSDRASRGDYEDLSGPAMQDELEARFKESRWRLEISRLVLPDEAAGLRETLTEAIDSGVDIIFTTGGTGIGPRDITPDVVAPLLNKTLPGIMEFIRQKHGERLPAALLSRSIAGTSGQTLLFTLPGSVKAVREYLEVIIPVLEHALLMLRGIDAHASAPMTYSTATFSPV